MLLSLGAILASCGFRGSREGRAVQIADSSYYFPAQHIGGFVAPEDSGSNQLYVRLAPPGGYYWLVHDPNNSAGPNRQGPNIPTIPHVNDNRFTEADVIESEVGPVLCRRNPVNDDSAYLRQIFTCGFRLMDGNVAWNVIIPGDLVASAPALKRRAELVLADYRADNRARRPAP